MGTYWRIRYLGIYWERTVLGYLLGEYSTWVFTGKVRYLGISCEYAVFGYLLGEYGTWVFTERVQYLGTYWYLELVDRLFNS